MLQLNQIVYELGLQPVGVASNIDAEATLDSILWQMERFSNPETYDCFFDELKQVLSPYDRKEKIEILESLDRALGVIFGIFNVGYSEPNPNLTPLHVLKEFKIIPQDPLKTILERVDIRFQSRRRYFRRHEPTGDIPSGNIPIRRYVNLKFSDIQYRGS